MERKREFICERRVLFSLATSVGIGELRVRTLENWL